MASLQAQLEALLMALAALLGTGIMSFTQPVRSTTDTLTAPSIATTTTMTAASYATSHRWGARKQRTQPSPPVRTQPSTPAPPASPAPSATPVTPTPSSPPPASNVSETRMQKTYTTAYTWWDNTPPGSADIAFPILHAKAGGTGTYADPITIAVGHVISGGKDTPDYPKGTIFYIPNVRAYFIVEDLCGDGNTPQNGPCHDLRTADQGATTWLDMWIDGQSISKSAANACAEALTANHLVIVNPAPNYAVVTGPIIQDGKCRQQYGETLATQ